MLVSVWDVSKNSNFVLLLTQATGFIWAGCVLIHVRVSLGFIRDSNTLRGVAGTREKVCFCVFGMCLKIQILFIFLSARGRL